MKVALVAIVAATFSIGIARADPAKDALLAKAYDCLRAGAPKVNAASQSLKDSVDFLVNDLCGPEVSRAEAYEASAQQLTEWQATTASGQLAGVNIDPVTGELNTPPGFSAPMSTGLVMLRAMRQPQSAGVEFRAVAAKALLATKTSTAP